LISYTSTYYNLLAMEGAIVGPSSLNGFLSHGMLDYQLSGSYEAMFDYPLSEFYEAEAQGP
jgi:hypothetical protein